jgi:hypothetical protein
VANLIIPEQDVRLLMTVYRVNFLRPAVIPKSYRKFAASGEFLVIVANRLNNAYEG